MCSLASQTIAVTYRCDFNLQISKSQLLLQVLQKTWEADANKQASVKKSTFSLNGGKAFCEGLGKEFYRKGHSVKRFWSLNEWLGSEKCAHPLPKAQRQYKLLHLQISNSKSPPCFRLSSSNNKYSSSCTPAEARGCCFLQGKFAGSLAGILWDFFRTHKTKAQKFREISEHFS